MIYLDIVLVLLSVLRFAAADRLGIVVARFKEPLEPWSAVANSTYVYAKGNVPQTDDTVKHSVFRSYIPLRNIGREGHTHLYHIANNYDTLDEVMIFSQGDPFDLISPAVNTTSQMVDKAMKMEIDDVTPFNPTLFHDLADWRKIDWNNSKQSLWITPNQIKTLTPARCTPAQFWTRVLGGRHPPAIRAIHGGIFAVRRETIWSLPRTVYTNALNEFERANSTNPEIGFFMERMWAPMLSRKYRLRSVQIP